MKAHDYPQIYKELEIDLSKLGCMMLDVKPHPNMYSIEVDGAGCALYYAKDKTRFWIDGWVADKLHVTLLYGLLKPAKEYAHFIAQVLWGWSLKTVEIQKIGYFDSPYPDEPYWCVVAHVKKTDELVEGNERLKMLPHIQTFPGYKAHMTICYLDKAQGEKYRDQMIKDFNKLWKGKTLEVTGLNFGGNT